MKRPHAISVSLTFAIATMSCPVQADDSSLSAMGSVVSRDFQPIRRSMNGESGVCFDLPKELVIDGLALARAALPKINLDAPDARLLDKHYYEPGGTAYLPFTAALPDQLKGSAWWLFGMGGVEKRSATLIAGTVGYGREIDSADPSHSKYSPRTSVDLSVCASTPEGIPEPVFATIARPGESLSKTQAEVVSIDISLVGGQQPAVIRGLKLDYPIRIASFSDGQQTYVIVTTPNTHGCADTYELYGWFDAHSRRLSASGGACD